MRPATVQSAVGRRIGTQRPWVLPVGRVAADLATDPVAGLPAAEAASRLARFGENSLVEQGRKPAWRLLAEQFANTMIVVLLLAAVVAAALGDLKDTVVILAILVLNGLLASSRSTGRSRPRPPSRRWPRPRSASGVAAGCRTCPPPRWCRATWCCSGRVTCSPPTSG